MDEVYFNLTQILIGVGACLIILIIWYVWALHKQKKLQEKIECLKDINNKNEEIAEDGRE